MAMDSSNPALDITECDGEEEDIDFFDELDDPNYVPPRALASLSSVPHITMQWIPYIRQPLNRHDSRTYRLRNKQITQRVRECSRALDLLEALQAGYEVDNILDRSFDITEFEGLLDLNKASIMGHSMGAATAIMSAAAELRFRTVICLDPWLYPIKDECFDLVSQPILMVGTEQFQDEPNIEKMKELLPAKNENDGTGPFAKNKAFIIKRSVHYNQCDIPFVFSWIGKLLFNGRSKRNPFTAHDITTSSTLCFIAENLGMCRIVFSFSICYIKNLRLNMPNEKPDIIY